MSEPGSGRGSRRPADVVGPHRDILATYRNRIMFLMAVACAVFLTPFAVHDFLQGRHGLGAAILAVVAILAVDAAAIHLGRPPPVPFAVLLLPSAVGIALALRQHGLPGALWSYPAVLFCYFVLTRRGANAGSLALGGFAAAMVYMQAGPEVAARFAVSLALTVVIINIILSIIGQLQDELLAQAVTDPLTGAYNRRQMDLSLSDTVERHRRTGAPASLLVIDIDHFKKVNDDFGHAAGDEVLRGLAALVRNRSRKLDRLFRMGGEEFVLLLPDTRADAAMKQAEDLRRIVGDAPLIAQRPVTISIGVAEYAAGQSPEAWVDSADGALYRAKAGGRNTVVRA